jgi:hypothetical protein
MSEWEGTDPDFDKSIGDGYLGKYILVKITYFDAQGHELRRVQLHGDIKSASAEGILIALKGVKEGETWNMPPSLESMVPAKRGRYTLESTGEVIEDPDFIVTWSMTEPQKH